MPQNTPPPIGRIILPNDPMSGEIYIKYNLRMGQIEIDSKGSDVRSAALATIRAGLGLVEQSFQAAGLIVPMEGGPNGNTEKENDNGS